MKALCILGLFILASCALHKDPISEKGNPVAFDQMASGNVRASAVKVIDQQEVCFNISLMMKGVDQKEAFASNWTLAWVDKDSRYHLLTMSQRDPASEPQGGGAHREWTNSFRTCTAQVHINDVKSLVLTPKELSYQETEGLNLEWK
jgi:hypothetical protein